MWADQFDEQTYIRYGKSKGGLAGMTRSAEQVACWVLSFPLCQRVSHAFETGSGRRRNGSARHGGAVQSTVDYRTE